MGKFEVVIEEIRHPNFGRVLADEITASEQERDEGNKRWYRKVSFKLNHSGGKRGPVTVRVPARYHRFFLTLSKETFYSCSVGLNPMGRTYWAATTAD